MKINNLFATGSCALLIPLCLFGSSLPNDRSPLPERPSICDAVSGNLLANCGFEAGDFSGWDQTGNADSFALVVGPQDGFGGFLPNSGSLFAVLGPVGTEAFLGQTIATVPGATYMITWHLASDGALPNSFDVSWDGNAIFGQSDIATSAFSAYWFRGVASASSTTLKFGFRNDLGFLAFDDTSVTAYVSNNIAPEPGTFFLIGSGLVGMVFGHRWLCRLCVNTAAHFAVPGTRAKRLRRVWATPSS